MSYLSDRLRVTADRYARPALLVVFGAASITILSLTIVNLMLWAADLLVRITSVSSPIP